jgi:hypothetical protein
MQDQLNGKDLFPAPLNACESIEPATPEETIKHLTKDKYDLLRKLDTLGDLNRQLRSDFDALKKKYDHETKDLCAQIKSLKKNKKDKHDQLESHAG